MLFLQIFDFCHLRIHLSYPSISTRLLYCLCFPRQPNTDRNLPSPLSKCSRNDLKSLVFEEFFKIPTLCQFAIQRCSVVEKEGRSVGGDHQMGIRRACETTRIDLNLEIFNFLPFRQKFISFPFFVLFFFFLNLMMHSDDFSLRLESGCIQNEEILVFRSNEVLFSSRVESD